MVGGIPYSIEIVLDNRQSIVYNIDTAIANRVIGRDCKQSLVPVGVLTMSELDLQILKEALMVLDNREYVEQDVEDAKAALRKIIVVWE